MTGPDSDSLPAPRAVYEPAGRLGKAEYEFILGWLCGPASHVSLIFRDGLHQSRWGMIAPALETFRVGELAVHSWPGTRLSSKEPATLLVYRYGEQVRDVLFRHTRSFDDWLDPDLPEDPAFYRPDRTCVLGTVVHEGYLDLVLDEGEASRLAGSVPLRRRAVTADALDTLPEISAD